MTGSLLAALAVLCAVSAPARAAAQPDSLARDRVVGALGAQLDSQLTRFAEYGFWGTVLVMRDRQVVLLKGYGLADARGVRNSAATRFEMNSMTKMFTGVSILQLAAAGRLRLGDDVGRHLGVFPAAKRGATVEQLAAHTSGLIVEGTDLAGDTREAFVRDVKQSPREAPPGEAYRYSNAGFSLLAAIIESATGQHFETYLRQHALEPAAMKTAVFRDEVPASDSLFARGYVGTPAALERGPPNPYVWGTRGAGGVWATVGDMYRWIVAVEDGVVLAEPERRLLFSPPKPPAQEHFGWHVTAGTASARAQIDKGGGSDDFASQLLYYPQDRVVIIWATNNLRQRWRQSLNAALAAIVFGGAPIALPQIAKIPPAELAGYAGSYVAGRDHLELKVSGEHLYAATNSSGVPTNVMFFPNGAGRFTAYAPAMRDVTRLVFSRDGSRSAVVTLADGRQIALRQ